MQVGDMVFSGRNAFQITGIFLGGVGTQNIVALKSLTLSPGCAYGSPCPELVVPEELVLEAGVYRRVD